MDATDPLPRSVPARVSPSGRGYTRAFGFSVRQILVSLVLLAIARPFLETTWGHWLQTALITFVLLSSLIAVGSGRRELVISLVLILPTLTFRWLSHALSLSQNDPLPLICLTLCFSFTIWQLLRFVVRAQQVDLNVLCAGISVYLLLGQVWGMFYLIVDRLVPGSFLFPGLPGHAAALLPEDAGYFSTCTLTTVGYGDIIPHSLHARSLATLESTTGVLYLAVLISRIVALHLADQVQHRQPPSQD